MFHIHVCSKTQQHYVLCCSLRDKWGYKRVRLTSDIMTLADMTWIWSWILPGIWIFSNESKRPTRVYLKLYCLCIYTILFCSLHFTGKVYLSANHLFDTAVRSFAASLSLHANLSLVPVVRRGKMVAGYQKLNLSSVRLFCFPLLQFSLSDLDVMSPLWLPSDPSSSLSLPARRPVPFSRHGHKASWDFSLGSPPSDPPICNASFVHTDMDAVASTLSNLFDEVMPP